MATYPVWIGNLKETVKEKDLMRVFSKQHYKGGIASCKIMRDENGQSKKFGYVNFNVEADAESAAVKMAGFKIESVPIKTKGPKALRESGHLAQTVDYRPLTDCSFYVQAGNCQKGEKCLYRHSDRAQANPVVCPLWLKKSCTNISCPNRHPSPKGVPKEAAPTEVQVGGGSTLFHCDGQCGDPICEALFKTDRALKQHINQPRHPQAVVQNDMDGKEESIDSESTNDLTEPSDRASDVEIITDSEPEEDTKSRPPGNGLGTTAVKGTGSPAGSDDSTGGGAPNGAYGYDNAIGYGYGTDGSGGSDENGGGDGGEDAEVDDQEDEGEEGVEQNEWLDLAEETGEGRTEYSRLESLTEDEPALSDNSFDQDGGLSPQLPSPVHVPRLLRHMEPVGVFWDIENCAVPPDKSAFALANKMRKMFFEGKREAEFMCVCDIGKERKEVMDDLNKALVTLVHVSAVAKNAADDKLRQSLRRFAHTYHPPCTLVLISGDVNFAPELKDLRHAHNITITLVHNRQASDALKVFANNLFLFDDLLQDLEPPSVQPQSSPCMVIVSGLPAVAGGPKKMAECKKIQARLSRLCDNCGGKVLKVNAEARTANIIFRSVEAATKAQKRMTGEDVCGSKIVVKLKRNGIHAPRKKDIPPPTPLQAPPRTVQGPYGAPTGPGNFNSPRTPHKFAESVNYLPVPYGGPPPKQRLSEGDLFAGPPPPPLHLMPLRSFTGPQLLPPPQRLPPPQPLPPPPQLLPPFPHTLPDQFDVKLTIRVQADERVRRNPNVLKPLLHDIFIKARVEAEHLAFLWCNYSQLIVLSKLKILQSAIQQKDAVADIMQRGLLTQDMARSFGAVCCKAIKKVCQQNLPWQVEVCSWGEDEERDKYTRSHVIELLLRQPDGYMNWTNFKAEYSALFGSPISELTIQTTCKDVIHLLGNASQKNQVIVLYELSPLIKVPTDVKIQQLIRNNLVGLLFSRPEKQIRLMKIVSAYEKKYGSLPVSKQGPVQPLHNIIMSTPNFIVKGKTPSSLLVTLKTASGAQELPSKSKPLTIEEIDANFQVLLKEKGSNGSLPYKNFQQTYQTYFHKSFRVSDFVDQPEATMLDLLKLCKGVRVQEDCIVLASSPAEPLPEENAPEISQASAEQFKKDCISVFGGSATPVMTLVQFKEQYEKHFGRQLKLAEYGAKKLIQLFEAVPDTVKIIGEKDTKCVQLLTDTQKDCELNIEKLLCDLPGHKIALDTFVFEYIKRFRVLDNSYYGHRKLLGLLEAMPNTLKLFKDGSKWVVTLTPVRLFACEIKELLADHPDGIGINAVNPAYKAKFQSDFSVANYGFSKLIIALEAIQDVIVIEGTGPGRKIKLRAVQSRTDASQAIAIADAVPTTPSVVTEISQPETQVGPTKVLQTPVGQRLNDAERHRLCSETKRILFSHPEHAMTVNELWECFVAGEDPASPTIDELYKCLKEESVKLQVFVISSFPGQHHNNLVQLNLKDCHNKLQQDLLRVFVCHPTADFSLHLNILLETYETCFGHALKPSVYAAVDVPGVMAIPNVAEVIKLCRRSSLCSLTIAGMHTVLTSLLAEVIFTRGSGVKLCDLPELYQRRFGVPLNLYGMPDLTSLINEPAFSKTFQVIDNVIDLSPDARFAEQMRHLLTIRSGRVPLNELNDLFIKEFGISLDQVTKKPLQTKIFTACSQIAKLAGRKWLVWMSPSCSYPPRSAVSKASTTEDAVKQAVVVNPPLADTNNEIAKSNMDVSDGLIPEHDVGVPSGIAPYNPEGLERTNSAVTTKASIDHTKLEPQVVSASDGNSSDGMSTHVVHNDAEVPTNGLLSDGLLDVDNSGSVGVEATKTTASCSTMDTSAHGASELDFGSMTKEQVIEIFQREKGNPAMMPRFLEYFGDLSGRELERVVPSSKEKPVSKSTPRRKTNMAIRFPVVPPAISTVDKTVADGREEQKELAEVRGESTITAVMQGGGVGGLHGDAAVIKGDDNGRDVKNNGVPPSAGAQPKEPIDWPAL